MSLLPFFDTGWSLQILFPDYNFIGSASKDRSILTAKGLLAIHPRVRSNHALMGLRRFRKITTLHTVERFRLTNILSVHYFFAELSLCVSPLTLGRDRPYKPEVLIIQGRINSLSPLDH